MFERITRILTKLIFLCSGILLLIFSLLAVSSIWDIRATTMDMRNISSQITIEDMRNAVDIIEKQLDKEILNGMIELQRGDNPLSFTPENWQAFIDFCNNTGYVVSDYNWQRYLKGQLRQ